MLDKAQQPSASRPNVPGRARAGRQIPRARLTLAALAATIAALVCAGPAGAAGPVEGLLDTVARTATPAVQAIPAVQEIASSPAAAQQAGDVAATTTGVEQTVDRATSPSGSSAGGEQPDASTHHGQGSSGGAPADRPENASQRDGNSHAPSAAPSREASGASSSGLGSSAASGHSSGSIGRLLTYSAVPAPKRATADGRRSPARHSAAPGVRGLLSAQTTRAASAVLARAVRPLALAPAMLGEASRAIGDVGETATRLVGSTRLAIAPLLAALQQTPLELPSLPALPVLTVPQAPLLQAQPTGLWPQIVPVSATEPERSLTARQQGAAPASAAPVPGLGWTGAPPTANTLNRAAAPQRRTSTDAPRTGTLAAAETTPTAPSVASTMGRPYATPAATGATAPLSALPAHSPTPSPGGVSAATGAIGGTSIPIFLTLAGLLLLAAPRVRRVLRLLGESWRLSPLALIPERPG